MTVKELIEKLQSLDCYRNYLDNVEDLSYHQAVIKTDLGFQPIVDVRVAVDQSSTSHSRVILLDIEYDNKQSYNPFDR